VEWLERMDCLYQFNQNMNSKEIIYNDSSNCQVSPLALRKE